MRDDAEVRTLWDHLELRRLRADYAKHLDHREWGEYASLFTEDALIEYDGLEPLDGRPDIEECARTLFQNAYDFSMHTAFMPSLEVTGERATGHWYLYVYYGFPDGDTGWVMGEYEDEYERIDGDWKFAYVTNTNHVDTTGTHIRG